MDLLTSGVTLSKLSGSTELSVNATQVLNNATSVGTVTGSGAASGSVLVTTSAPITTLKFQLYLRGDGRATAWYNTNTTQHAGDGWLIGVSTLSAPTLTGVVFEDVNYGGGSGRPSTVSGAAAVPNATVELYTSAGTYIRSTTTDANGKYSFNIANGTYTVRVVNSTVTSSRTGASTNLIPVQTYNGSTNTVGGQQPALMDAPANNGSQLLTTLTNGGVTPESIASITTSGLATAGPDFGFNYDLVVNGNDSGQGSLRQFIINSNMLTDEASLVQSGSNTAGPLPAGNETSIFMIPNGAATPPAGLRTGLTTGLAITGNNTGAAVITLQQALPPITGANTNLDATTQTFNIDNSNANTVGSGGTVGTDGLTLSTIQRPELVINANNTTQPIIVQGNAVSLTGFAIYNANSTSSTSAITVASNVTGAANRAELSQLLIGTFGDGTDPGASRNRFGGVHFDGSFNFTNNYVAYNGEGLSVGNRDAVTAFAANAALITNNDFLTNGAGFGSGDNLSILASTGLSVTGNLMRNAQGSNFNYTGKGVELNNKASNNTIDNNTITGSAIAGIGISQGSNNNTISRNIISGTVGGGANTGPGVLIVTENLGGLGGLLPPTGNTITQNSIFANNGLSIDLINSNGQGTNGGILGDGPTLNDNGDADTNLPNEMQNYPVITSAAISGTNLYVKGYARAGSIIELFNVGATADPSGFGEGRTYLGTVTEGSTADNDKSTNQSYSGFINGMNQGSDNTANGFSFTIPISSLAGGTLALRSVLSSTATLAGNTSEFSGNVVVRDLTVANDDDVTTPINTPITFAVTANDTPTGDITANSIDLDPNTAGIQTSITTPEGTFTTVGVTAGSVKFTPTSATFLGIAKTPYTVTNSSGAVSNQANLIVRVETKTDVATTITGPATVVAGGTVLLSGTTVNNSLVTVATVSQSIQLPAGVSGNITISQNGGGVSNQTFSAATTNTGLFTFSTISLAPGATSNYTLSFNAPLGGSFTATALVTPTANDINLANNAAAVVVAVTPQFDLSTIITGPTANPVAGNLVSYAVTTANGANSSPAADVVQTVQLPTGVTGVFTSNGGVYSATAGSVTFNGVTYAVAARTVTFPPVSLAAGQVVNNVVGFVAPAAGTALSVTATVPTTNDVATANNTSTASSTTQATTTANANLYVTVTGPAQATATNVITYTVKQGNNGPSTATAVQTTVGLPANLPIATLTLNGSTGNISGSVLTFGSGATASTYNLNTGVFTLAAEPTQASGATEKSYDIAFAAPANSPVVSVTASVGSATTDPVPADNQATTQTEILPSADVSITLNNPSGNSSVPAGQRVTYAVQTQNNSDYIAQNVQQTVNLQPGLTVASLLLNGASGTLSAGVITFGSGSTASTYNVSTGLLTLPLIGSLPKGTLINNTISLVASGINTATGIRAVAAVTSTTPDAVSSNNSAAASNGINTVEDLTVTIAGPAQAVIGNPLLYTITTTNNGPSATGNQTTTVQLPMGLSNVEVRDNSGAVLSGAYNATTGVVSFATTTAVPAVGQSVQGTISFVAPDNNQISLAAATGLTTTSSGNYEANIDNNTARVSTTLVAPGLAPADLGTKFNANPPASLTVGAAASYTIVTFNNGAATTQNAVQLVNLPAGLSTALTVNGVTGTLSAGIISFGGGITYNVSTGLLTVPSATGIANGGSLQSIVAFPMPTTNVTVKATSVADNPDGVATNNIVYSSTTATATSDVMLSMTGPSSAIAGSTATYAVVVTNNGPSTASTVTATFTLPPTVTTYTANGTTTTVAAGSTVTLQPSFQSLQSGASLDYLVSYTAPAATYTQSAAVTAAAASNTVTTNDNGSVKTLVNIAPVANDVVNKLQTPEGNTAITGLLLTSLSGSDADGSVASYNITSIPNTATQGTLFYNNGGTSTAVVVGQSLTTTQAGTLRFDPVSTFVGSVFFTYTATDNGNGVPADALTSAPARYTVQVGQDNSSVYTANDPKGGVNAYIAGDEIARVYDYNGGKATNPTAAGKDIFSPNPKDRSANYGSGITDNGVRSAVAGVFATGSAMPGKTLADINLLFDAVTGRITMGPLVTAADRAKVKAGTYTLPITTTDVNGGTNTQNVSFTIGAFPLPVELTDFTASAVRNVDAALLWHTAQEQHN
ncbi:hypothetical protein KB206_21265, partial [Microvirga sp. STS02]|nr:hypothetical protein [Microvirga sp. STS02]